MELVQYTNKKLAAVLLVIEALQSGDFPHSHSKPVLDRIETLLQERVNTLGLIQPDTDQAVTKTICKEILHKIFTVYPLLGFIARSMDVRNSFELHGPFLNIVSKALGEDAKLIISSEWDFSPFTYNMPGDLGFSKVVFIGIPVSESGNGLAIPLSGHELGHNIWRAYKFHDKYYRVVEETVVRHIEKVIWDEFQQYFPAVGAPTNLTDMIGQQYWLKSWYWSMSQCEEIFCDFIGLLLFRESYLHAFAYLIAPGLFGSRAEHYPNMLDRVAALRQASDSQGIVFPDSYANLFEDSDTPPDAETRLLLSISDAATKQLIEQLCRDAASLLNDKGLLAHSFAATKRIEKSFSMGVPAISPQSLTNIINAAWNFSRNAMPGWSHRYPSVYTNPKRCEQMLNDLIFKSIEVLEINQIQGIE